MSDQYIAVPQNQGFYTVWQVDADGKHLNTVAHNLYAPLAIDQTWLHDVMEELNRLARLADDTANMVRAEERTKVRNAIDRNVITTGIHERSEDEPLIHVLPHYWNQLVRALKAVREVVG